jgi:hypothetical protein
VFQVSLSVDGKTQRYTGTALVVDPGQHAFTFTVPGQEPVTRSFFIVEGVKDRHERISLGATLQTPR